MGWTEQLAEGADEADAARGAGIVVEDLDGDGALDVFLPNMGPCLLFLGDGEGGLEPAPASALPTGAEACHAWGAAAADVDGDGRTDLFLARNGAPDVLWWGSGGGRFVKARAGLGGETCGSRSASFGDLDGDGDLDLFVARHHVVPGGPQRCDVGPSAPSGWEIDAGDPSVLYENLGDGSFRDARGRLPVAQRAAWSFLGAWADLDADGHTDLYLVHDYGRLTTPNALLRGDGEGGLREDTPEGLGVGGDVMGVGLGDINEDGALDMVLSDIDDLWMRLSTPGGVFVEAAVARGFRPDRESGQRAAWGLVLADVDNDTLLDVLVPYGPTESVLAVDGDQTEQPDALFLQTADGRFEDVAPQWGLDDTGAGRGVVVADIDGDGWLDLFTRDYRGGPARLWRARCGDAAWLSVRLEGAPPAAHALGARVRVRVGDRWLSRFLLPGSTGLASQGPAVLHFGLADAEQVEELEVRWPDGSVSAFTDVPTRRHVRVVRGVPTE